MQTVLNSTHGAGTATSVTRGAAGVRVRGFQWEEVERWSGLTFNTAIFDCEGW